jgi:hypothetical protein
MATRPANGTMSTKKVNASELPRDKLNVYRRYFLKMWVMMFFATGLGDAKNR